MAVAAVLLALAAPAVAADDGPSAPPAARMVPGTVAIDLAAEKLQNHLAREKDRRVRGRRGGKVKDRAAAVAMEPKEPTISRISRVTPRTLSIAQAARALDESELDFLLFLGPDDAPRIIYRRQDGTYGLLEPNL